MKIVHILKHTGEFSEIVRVRETPMVIQTECGRFSRGWVSAYLQYRALGEGEFTGADLISQNRDRILLTDVGDYRVVNDATGKYDGVNAIAFEARPCDYTS